MSEPSQKCENYAIFEQNYTLQLFNALKMAYCCCFGLRGNLDFPDFLQKSFITSTTNLVGVLEIRLVESTNRCPEFWCTPRTEKGFGEAPTIR